jgi:UDP-galactose transporter B1
MARRKQVNPQRIDEHDFITDAAESLTHQAEAAPDHGSSIFQLIICVGGIYASLYSFLSATEFCGQRH